MIKWREAYERVRTSPEYKRYFGGNLPMSAFYFKAYSQRFEGVPGQATAGAVAISVGPIAQNFPSGAIVLGITAGAFEAQQVVAAAAYAPSVNPGRRDLFAINLQYPDEPITTNGLTMAEALLGSGYDTIFPARELLIPPSQNLLCQVANMLPTTLNGQPVPALTIHVVYHAMIPRAVG